MMGLMQSSQRPAACCILLWISLLPLWAAVHVQVSSFSVSNSRSIVSSCGARRRCTDERYSRSVHFFPLSMSTNDNDNDNDWLDLSGDGGVQKQIVSEGSGGGQVYSSGTPVTIQYTGTTAVLEWSAQEVVTCWLSEQQGVEDLADSFVTHQVDVAMLTNPDMFQEDFVTSTLGVEQKIKCKKLVMAAKRLAKTSIEFPIGTVFDENDSFEFTLGKKVIKGMDVGVSSMLPGETSLLKVRCDYAYGGDGYRKKNGDVMVPPFATLQFEITLR